jgi:hypothetical protein
VYRATKIAVFTSNLVAVWLLARLVSFGYPTILVPAICAFAISAAGAFIAGDLAATVVLVAVYFVPVICAAWLHAFYYSYYAIWMAAIAGAMLPRASRSGWNVPARFRGPLALWAVILAVAWPLIVLREIDFTPELLERGNLWNSRLSVSPPMASVWILSVSSIVMTGLLLLDWLFEAYPAEQLKRFESRVIWPLFGAAAASALVADYQLLVDLSFLNHTAFEALGRAVGTLRDANPFGMISAMWVPIGVAVAIGSGSLARRVTGGALAIAIAGGVWASGSRTALLCVIVALAVMMISLIHRLSRKGKLTAIGAALILLLGLFVVASTVSTGPWRRLRQFTPLASTKELKFTIEQLWGRDYGPFAERMIAEHPLVGIGPGGFNYLYADTLYLMGGTVRPPDNAQNWYRQQLAELGLLGSAGWIVWAALFGWALISCRGPRDRLPMIAALKGSVLGLAAASLLGMPTQDTAASITFVVLATWCLKMLHDGSPPQASFWPEKFERLAIATVTLCFLAGTAYEARTDLRPAVRAQRAEFPYRYGFGAFDENDREFQWTGRHAVDVFPAENRYVRLLIGAVAPNAAAHPVIVKVWRDDELILKLTRSGNFPVERWVRLRDGERFARLEIQVSRTWRATDIGRDDPRERGVAVGTWIFAHWTPKGAVLIE